jgi:small conductance mechanosensitive channel
LAIYVPKIILAGLTVWIGFKVANFFKKLIEKTLEKKSIDISLAKFLGSLTTMLLKTIIIVSAIGMLGVNTTSFIAIIGAAGLAVGLALQGTLANFAGGTLLLILRPFKVGDFIEAQGFSGVVKKIDIFSTVLLTVDRKTIIIPNGPLSTGSITNFSSEAIRRVDMTFGIGYNDDLKLAKLTLETLIKEDDRVLRDHDITVAVSELADSSVNFTVRAFVKSEDYWSLFFDMQERVKLEFDKKNISIPYPQQDLHVHGIPVTNGMSTQ